MDADLIYKIILAIAVFVLGWNFKNFWEELKQVKKDMKEITGNYIHRFEDMKETMNEGFTEINKGFTEIKVLIAQYNTKLDNLLYQHNEAMKNNSCPVQHKHKEE